MFGLSQTITKLIFGGIILAVLIGLIYMVYQAGGNAERAATLQNSMDAIKERSETNERIDNLTSAQLCVALDGVWDKATQTCE